MGIINRRNKNILIFKTKWAFEKTNRDFKGVFIVKRIPFDLSINLNALNWWVFKLIDWDSNLDTN